MTTIPLFVYINNSIKMCFNRRVKNNLCSIWLLHSVFRWIKIHSLCILVCKIHYKSLMLCESYTPLSYDTVDNPPIDICDPANVGLTPGFGRKSKLPKDWAFLDSWGHCFPFTFTTLTWRIKKNNIYYKDHNNNIKLRKVMAKCLD